MIHGETQEVLSDSMKILAEFNLAVTQIDGRQESESGKQSCVFVEIQGHQTEPAIGLAVARLKETGKTVRILGSYPAGRG